MQLISTLAAGVNGAALGTAAIFRRGTSNRPTLYASFEGDLHPENGADVELDSYGRAVVYINELVDVQVRNSDGGSVVDFTEGSSSANVEVRSLSFTGRDYSSGQTGAGKPTTAQEVFDLWVESAGATDFEVSVGGSNKTIEVALAAVAGVFYNVKDPTYGAVGDGVVNDAPAIQAALTAAGTTGGIVLLPAGTYLVSTTLNVPGNVSLWGVGVGSTVIVQTSASNAGGFEYPDSSSGYQEFRGIQVYASQANSGPMIKAESSGVTKLAVINSRLGLATNTGYIIQLDGSHSLLVDMSELYVASTAGWGIAATNGVAVNGSTVTVRNSSIQSLTTAEVSLIVCRNLVATGNVFSVLSHSAGVGTSRCVSLFGTAGTGPNALIVGNNFYASTSGISYPISTFTDNEANTAVFESSNNYNGAFTGYYSGWQASSNAPRHVAGSRPALTLNVTDNTASFDVEADQYGTTLLTRTATGAQTLTSSVGPGGAEFTLIVFNDAGGALGTLTFGTGFAPNTPTVTALADQRSVMQKFRATYIDGSAVWMPIAPQIKDV